jgi:hypothetical protein
LAAGMAAGAGAGIGERGFLILNSSAVNVRAVKDDMRCSMSSLLQLMVSSEAFDSRGPAHIRITRPFRQSENRAEGRPAKAQRTRLRHRKMRVSCVRAIGPAKQMVSKRSPPSGFAGLARALHHPVIRPCRALLEKLAPIGYQDEAGFHYDSNGQAQPNQSASPTILRQ